MSPEYTDDDLDVAQGKPRPKGSLPYLPNEREPEALRAWLTLATRPVEGGFKLSGFDRLGRDAREPCVLHFANGRESRKYRIKRQSDLMRNPRMALVSATDAWLDVPHLTPTEAEDVWAALCRLGNVLSEFDEVEQTREWLDQLLPATLALTGYSLVPDARHDGLMAIRAAGIFGKGDALAMIRPGEGDRYRQRPTRFVDAQTGEQWLRASETATYVRHVIGVEPLQHSVLKARLHEVGVVGRYFEDYRPPHPKLALYQLTDELIENVEGGR
jgi:hypothetical protein